MQRFFFDVAQMMISSKDTVRASWLNWLCAIFRGAPARAIEVGSPRAMRGTGVLTRSMLVLFGLGLVLPAQGASLNSSLDDTVTLRLGPFLPNIETKVSVAGRDFSQEERFSNDESTVMLKGLWRITRRVRFELSYWKVARDSNDTLPVATDMGGIAIPAGTNFAGSTENSVLAVSLGYALVKNESTEFGLRMGLNVTSIKSEIVVTPPGGPSISASNDDVTEPLPSIGAFLEHAFAPQWSTILSAGAFGLKVGDLDGTFYYANAGIEWHPWKNVGFGAAYSYNYANATLTKDHGTTDFDYTYKGPFAYLVLGF